MASLPGVQPRIQNVERRRFPLLRDCRYNTAPTVFARLMRSVTNDQKGRAVLVLTHGVLTDLTKEGQKRTFHGASLRRTENVASLDKNGADGPFSNNVTRTFSTRWFTLAVNLLPRQTRYSTVERECLDLILAVRNYGHICLYCKPFQI